METIFVALALLPWKFLSLVEIRRTREEAVLKYIAESSALRLGVAWLTWIAASLQLIIQIRASPEHLKVVVLFVVGAIFLAAVVMVLFLASALPRNREHGVKYSFVSAPLFSRGPNLSPLNVLVLVGIAADMSVIGFKVLFA